MGKISNVFTMASLLSSGRKYSIEELSRLFEVTPRMVRLYKEELEKCGIYIDSIRGPYGGYVLNQSIKVPTRKFKLDDYNLLKTISKDIKNPETKDRLLILADKIQGIKQESIQEELELKGENLNKYNILNKAIKEKRKVKILYYSYNKGENERIIHPFELFLFPSGWGVASFCEKRSDLRHFELKRIIKIDILEDKF